MCLFIRIDFWIQVSIGFDYEELHLSASDDAQEIEDSMMEDYKNSSHRRVTFEPGDVSLKQAFTVKSRAEACVTIQEIRKFAF